MNLSGIFIARPVGTSLLTAGVILAGALAFRLLPVAPLPSVDIPTISVSAQLPGASPETMAATVATPLERALGQISSVTDMSSSSTQGQTRITLQFDLSRDINGAARDVQAAINNARTLLPSGMPANPQYRKINPADAPILILALTSATMTRGQLYDVAETVLVQKLARVQGVGQVEIGGSSQPAVRVGMNAPALEAAGISTEQVRTAITGTNANRPKGYIEAGDRRWQIGANDQAMSAREYNPVVVAYRNGAAVRLSDVAEIKDSVKDVRNAGFSDGKPAVLLILTRQPNANIIETVDRVTSMLPQLRAAIPAAVDLRLVLDRTLMIRASVREVEHSLITSVILVILVVFIFLRRASAAWIPAVAVPVSLIGTFGIMYLAGFSIDNLSLMALTIATGFVVDDAVVVLENVSRHIDSGKTAYAAAIVGAREVGFTVLSMSLSLVAVFIPILFMGGIVGRLFREFALTLSAAILISLLVSLSTTAMMCARLLKANAEPALDPAGFRQRAGAAAERGYDALLNGYRRSLNWAMAHGRLMMLILLGAVFLNVYLYIKIDKTFFPQQDSGRIIGNIQGDQSTSFEAMQGKLIRFMRIIRADPAVDTVAGFTGGGGGNSGRLFMMLKPRPQRTDTSDQVIARLRKQLAGEPGATLYLQAAQDVGIGGRMGNAQFQYTLQADDLSELRAWEPKVRLVMSKLPELTDVNTDAQDRGSSTYIAVDKDAAARLGVTQLNINTTLNNLFGQRQVSTIYTHLNQYRVVMEAAPAFLSSPESLRNVFVTGVAADGKPRVVPLSSIARVESRNTALSVNHQGAFAAATISFGLPEGGSLSEATAAIDDAMRQLRLPAGVQGGFQGTAKAFQESLASQPLLILAALIAVYVVLGVLYESYVHPLTILSTLPSAGIGALLALMLTDTEFSIIALIGVLLLIGIVKKNAIMMIDFAIDSQRRHQTLPEVAIVDACLQRFRPIMMTTLAALAGALPLALGSGDGAELRHPLGISIAGGLIVSQLLTLYTTPLVYVYLDRWQSRLRAGQMARRTRRAALREQWQTESGA